MGPGRRIRTTAAALLCLALASAAHGQATPNYRGAALQTVVEGVAKATGKAFVIDPSIDIREGLTLIAYEPMSADSLYQAFLSMLSTHGVVAVPSGAVVRLMPDRTMRIFSQVPEGELAAPELQTLVLPVANLDVQTLVPILRPMMSPGGHLAAHAATNALILSGRGSNLHKLARVVERIDHRNDQPVEVMRLEHASARDVAGVLAEIARAANLSASSLAVADSRTNSILLGGEQTRRLQLRAIVAHLDTPLAENGNMRVRYLSYANAVTLAAQLSEQFGSLGDTDNRVQLSADEDTNALIIDAPPETLRKILAVVDQLDIRRAQVLVEVLIAEINAERANQLGVNWAAYDPQRVVGSTDFPAAGTSLRELVAGSLSGTDQGRALAARALGPGAGFAVGRVRDGELSFAALISAVENTAGANILGTPMLVTLDNQKAEFKVGQSVPFITGSYASPGINPSSGDGQIRPFTTVNRGDIGLTLTITPRINQGDAVRLEIRQELSEIAPSVAGAVDLVTNTRALNTSVIVEDGGTLVLGGLIQEKVREKRQAAPLLGRLPLIGALFRATSESREKTNLMLFIRPTILRDSAQAESVTNVKYDYLRRQQLIRSYSGEGPLLPEAMEDALELPQPEDALHPGNQAGSGIPGDESQPGEGGRGEASD